MYFAHNLKFLMERNGVSNYQLAKSIGCHQSNVAYWLSGDRIPQPRMRKAVADYFGVSISWLMGESSASDVLVMTAIDNGLLGEELKNFVFSSGDDSKHVQQAESDKSDTIDRALTEREKAAVGRTRKVMGIDNKKSPAPEGAELSEEAMELILKQLSPAQLADLMGKVAQELKERGLE